MLFLWKEDGSMPYGKENVRLAIKSIGYDLINRADDIVNDLKFANQIKIEALITGDEIVNYDVKKNYLAPIYTEKEEN